MNFSKTNNKLVVIDGGFDTESDPLDIPSGMIVAGSNHELADPRGIRRIMGYERVDHRVPSEANYTYITGTYVGDVSEGATVTSSGGATGIVLEDYVSGNPLIIYMVSGVLTDGDDITGVVTGIAVTSGSGATDINQNLAWKHKAIDACRGLIQEVPGTGNIAGAIKYNGDLYAFRGSGIYYTTPSGWTQLQLGKKIYFNTGSNDEPSAGDVLTNGTATADIISIQLFDSGSWGSGNAKGVFIIENVSGTFSSGDSLTITGKTTTSTAESGEVQIARNNAVYLRGGVYNFGGAAYQAALYVTDGANYAAKIDHNQKYIPVYTGMEATGIYPKHIQFFHHHLFLSYRSSWRVSALGDPLKAWILIKEADQWAMGDNIVGSSVTPSNTMVSFQENSINIIYMTDSGDFVLKPYTNEYGAAENSIQLSLAPTFISESGINVMTQTQKWGDFEVADIDKRVKTLVDVVKHNVTSSVIFRNKGEYRVYSNNICVRMKVKDSQIRGFTLDAYPIPIKNIIATTRDGVREDEAYFVSSDNYVYKMDSGFSFDGSPVDAVAVFAREHLGQPRRKKKWYATMIEAEAKGGLSKFYVKKDMSLYHPSRKILPDKLVNVDIKAMLWDADKWDEVVWADSGGEDNDIYYTVNRRGTSAGVGIIIFSENTHEAPYLIRLINHRYAWRGEERQ